MAHRTGRKEEGRARILESAGRGFRRHGFGGLGIDGLAKQAGVTSGAFYAHFASKADAFRDAVVQGMRDLHEGILAFRAREGAAWPERFVAFYLAERRTCDLGEACALQSLTGEVSRADAETRRAYEAELARVIDAAAAGLPGATEPARRGTAMALLGLLAGAVGMARAVEDAALSQAIAEAAGAAARRLLADANAD